MRDRRNLILSTAAIVALAVPLAGLVTAARLEAQAPTAQAPAVPQWQIDAGGKMAFDVASVKQNKSGLPPSGDKPYTNFVLGPGDGYAPNGGLFSAINQALLIYVAFAYKITNNELPFLMSQMPKWTTLTVRFDIQARGGSNPTKDQMRLMMQSLLADRFKLAIHTETRQLPVFGLVPVKTGKTGPRLQQHPDDSSCSPASPPTPTPGSAPAPTAAVAGGFPATCGGFVNLHPCPSGRSCLGARNVSLGLIANTFSGPGFANLDRPVLDQTGLTGKFDFTIEFTPQFNGPVPLGADSQPDPTGPTFLEALRDQLGLKLVPQTGGVDVLVIDHVEEPSPN
jgi:uncharacterized protein (TIGR03435 family)